MGTKLSKEEFIEALRKIDLPEIFGFDISSDMHIKAIEVRDKIAANQYLRFRKLWESYLVNSGQSENFIVQYWIREMEMVLLPDKVHLPSTQSDQSVQFDIFDEEAVISNMKYEDIEEAKALVNQMFILLEVFYPISTTIRVLGHIESVLDEWEEDMEEQIEKDLQ